jgi:energy-coupling factor transporter ATP-binding protein EcfA2
VLRKVLIRNYRVFKKFELGLEPGVNVVIGNNDAGKSTLLEAINLALTFRLHGNPITSELSPFLFNWATTQEYVKALLWFVALGIAMLYLITKPSSSSIRLAMHPKKRISWLREAQEAYQQELERLVWAGGSSLGRT